MSNHNLLVVTGPTASGKTGFASELAYRLQGEIISADSRQVYKGMDLGTGKDLDDYVVKGREIPYHLIDILDAGQAYDVYTYQQDFYRVFKDIRQRGRMPVLCGGSGLYVEAAAFGYAMKQAPKDDSLRAKMQAMSMDALRRWYFQLVHFTHNTTDTQDRERLERAIEIAVSKEGNGARERPDIRPLIFVVYFERENQKQRIKKRLLQRLKEGMTEEVARLMQEDGVARETLEYYGLEYRYISRYLAGELTYNEMVEQLFIAIRQFAKKQMTWFRRMEKKGHSLHWIPGEWPLDEKLRYALQQL